MMIRMAAAFQRPAPRTVRLTARFVYALVLSVMALVGLAFGVVALAAGVSRLDVLALLFLIGAFGSLCLLIVWYLLQLRPR
jgi:hypothetical protein